MKFSVLFLDKVLLGRPPDGLRGVELFNINLLRDLAAAGLSVTVPAHPAWCAGLRERCGTGVTVTPRPAGGGLLGVLRLALGLRRGQYDTLLLGNVANRLIPALRLLRVRLPALRMVLIAHRVPSARFLRVLNREQTRVAAVSGPIAAVFRDAGFRGVDVFYGITNAAAFHPPSQPESRDTVEFCVLGHLDAAWKGADTAMAAFARLSPAAASRCRLHLVAFREPPESSAANVVTYRPMDPLDIPGFLRRMDVMLIPSRDEDEMRETFSQATVQGMLTGLPCVVSDLPVLTEKFDAGGGLVFRDIPELADHIETLSGDNELRRRLGGAARQTALQRYVWDTSRFVDRFLMRLIDSAS